MKNLLELLVATNSMIFVLESMFAGLALGAGLNGKALTLGCAALVHGLVANQFKALKEKKYP